MAQAPGQLGTQLVLLAVENVGAAVLDGDARRHEPVVTVLLEFGLALGRPPEPHERFAQLRCSSLEYSRRGPRGGPPYASAGAEAPRGAPRDRRR